MTHPAGEQQPPRLRPSLVVGVVLAAALVIGALRLALFPAALATATPVPRPVEEAQRQRHRAASARPEPRQQPPPLPSTPLPARWRPLLQLHDQLLTAHEQHCVGRDGALHRVRKGPPPPSCAIRLDGAPLQLTLAQAEPQAPLELTVLAAGNTLEAAPVLARFALPVQPGSGAQQVATSAGGRDQVVLLLDSPQQTRLRRLDASVAAASAHPHTHKRHR